MAAWSRVVYEKAAGAFTTHAASSGKIANSLLKIVLQRCCSLVPMQSKPGVEHHGVPQTGAWWGASRCGSGTGVQLHVGAA